MAKTYKAVLNFLDAEGKTITFSYSNANFDPDENDIKSMMNAFITNGSIFKKVPVSKKSMYIVATDQTEFSVE